MSIERSTVRVVGEELKSNSPKALKEVISRPADIQLQDWKEMDEDEQIRVAADYRAERKARIAQVLERGIVVTRLAVDLPNDLHGEWVRNSGEDIQRMKLLGYDMDSKHATNRALHSEGDGKSIVGDCIFMTCSREEYDLAQEVKQDMFDRTHGTSSSSTQSEDKQFTDSVRSKTPELPVIDDSKARTVRKDEIEAALESNQ